MLTRSTIEPHDILPAKEAVDERGELLDLGAVWRAIRRHWMAILVATTLALGATAFIYFSKSPIYVATAKLMVERVTDRVVPATENAEPVVPTDSPTVDTAVQVLESPKLAGLVVDRLNLSRNPEFNPDLVEPPEGPPATPKAARERAVRILLSRLAVQREGVSYAIAVHYFSPDPATAAAVANATMDTYLDQQRQVKTGDTERTAELLEERLGELRGQVLAAERAVANYRAQHGLFAASSESSVTQQQLSVLDTQLAEARAAEAAAEARLAAAMAQVQTGASGAALGEALNSDVIRTLRQQRAQLSATAAQLATRYGARHPDRVEAEEQVADLDRAIEAELNRIVSSIATEADVARQRTQSIGSSINRLQGRLATDNSAAVRLSELERNAASTRAIYQTLLDNYRQTLAKQGTESSGARAISAAQVPVLPSEPNPLMFLILGLLAAGALSGFTVLTLEMRQRGLRTSDSVERRLGRRALGSVPEMKTLPEAKKLGGAKLDPMDFVVAHPRSAFTESFRTLKTSLMLGDAAGGLCSVTITSALPGEGKTSTALCLARTSALSGTETLLIDGDTRRQAATRRLGLPIARSLADVLSGQAPIEEAIVQDPASGAWLLGQSESHDIPLELLGSEQMATLLYGLRQRFGLVILDGAPVLPVAEARVAAKMTDATLFLVRWSTTPAKAAELALSRLDDVGARVAGVALTRVDVAEQARTGFGDPGFYFKQYSEYYA